jgi:hypothetical protein
LSYSSSVFVSLVSSSSSGGISHNSQEADNCNVGKDASISVASSPSKYKIQQRQKEKMVANKSQPGVKPTIMKKKPKLCSSMGCANQARKGGVCVTHGAIKKHKLCSHDGCTKQAVKGGVCITHGATREHKRCSFDGCTNQAVKGGVCVTHGAKRKRCSFDGCTSNAKKGGVCYRHRLRSFNHSDATAKR